jgi:hypothetical protein
MLDGVTLVKQKRARRLHKTLRRSYLQSSCRTPTAGGQGQCGETLGILAFSPMLSAVNSCLAGACMVHYAYDGVTHFIYEFAVF